MPSFGRRHARSRRRSPVCVFALAPHPVWPRRRVRRGGLRRARARGARGPGGAARAGAAPQTTLMTPLRVGLNLSRSGERAGGVGSYARRAHGGARGARRRGAAPVRRPRRARRRSCRPPRLERCGHTAAGAAVGGPPLHLAAQFGALPALALVRAARLVHSPANAGPVRIPGVASVVTLHDTIWAAGARTTGGAPPAVRSMYRVALPTARARRPSDRRQRAHARRRARAVRASARPHRRDPSRRARGPGGARDERGGAARAARPRCRPRGPVRGAEAPVQEPGGARARARGRAARRGSARAARRADPVRGASCASWPAKLGVEDRLHLPGWLRRRGPRGSLPAGRLLRAPLAPRGLRAARAGGHGPRRARSRAATAPRCPRWPATRRCCSIPTTRRRWSAALDRLLRDAEPARRRSPRVGSRARREFTWAAAAEATVASYRRALAQLRILGGLVPCRAMPRILIVRGRLVTPWELRPWAELPGPLRRLLPAHPLERVRRGLAAPPRAAGDLAARPASPRSAGRRRRRRGGRALPLGRRRRVRRGRHRARRGALVLVLRRRRAPQGAPRLPARPDRLGDASRSCAASATGTRAATATRCLPRPTCSCRRPSARATALLLEGVPEERIMVCPPGIDVERFGARPPGSAPDEHVVLSPGRLVWEKGHQDVLRAVALLAREGLHPRVRIVGRGPEEARLREYAEELGLGDRVEIGAVPYDEMPEVFAVGLVHGPGQPAERGSAAAPLRRPAHVLGGAVRHGPRRGDGRGPRHPGDRQRCDTRGARRRRHAVRPGRLARSGPPPRRRARSRVRQANGWSTRPSSLAAIPRARWPSGWRAPTTASWRASGGPPRARRSWPAGSAPARARAGG